MIDFHELPKLRDSLSYLYVEHAVIDRDQYAIEIIRKEGRTHAPAAALSLLLLGPGTSITHAAIKLLAENGCTILWTGEDGMRLYAQGLGETRKAYHLLRQAELVCDQVKRAEVVRRMYAKRFAVELDPGLSLPQIRGLEGVRVRTTYAEASKTYGVAWNGRVYDRRDWGKADPINRALSAANTLLNGICHAGIVSGGYSPTLGFVHTGKMLSFVYDISDLYKTEITIPIAFAIVAESEVHAEKRVRQACRQKFYETKLLERLLKDIDELLGIRADENPPVTDGDGSDGAMPEPIWEELLDEGRADGMVVIILENVSTALRGELSRWLIEPHTGVFVGHVNAMVRDKLWEKCCQKSKEGGVLQIWSTNNEQHFDMRMWGGVSRRVVDWEGLKLVEIPSDYSPAKEAETKKEA